MNKSDSIRFAHYSIQFACLQKLKKQSLITDDEYEAIKKKLMCNYHIVSNLAA